MAGGEARQGDCIENWRANVARAERWRVIYRRIASSHMRGGGGKVGARQVADLAITRRGGGVEDIS